MASEVNGINAAPAVLVALAHAGVIALHVVGAWAVWCNRFAREWPLPHWQRAYLHLVLAGAVSFLVRGDCVLTALENQLRGPAAYPDGFLSHYLPWLPSAATNIAFVGLSFSGLIAVIRSAFLALSVQALAKKSRPRQFSKGA